MNFFSNHIAKEILTKGLLGQSSLVTKGILSILIAYELVNSGGEIVGSGIGFPLPSQWSKEKIQSLDVKTIKVYIDWRKKPQFWKKIKVEKIKKNIEVLFLERIEMKNEIRIEVKFLEQNKDI